MSIDIGAVKLVISHVTAVHGLALSIEPVTTTRFALKQLGLGRQGRERDRRPTQEEITLPIDHFDGNPRHTIRMGQVIRFAIATAMRQGEIFRIVRDDYMARTKMLTIRYRKSKGRQRSENAAA